MNIAKLKNKAEGLVTQLTAKDECEKRVLDAMSNHKYSAPRSLLNEVAEDTFSHDSYSAVMRLVWKTIDSPPRNWRAIAKALILLDHLVKNGAEKVVADAQQHIHDITYLNEFRYIEGNLDRGSGVREKAQDLANLLGNPDRIQAERRRAKDLRSQYSGYGASDPPRLSSSGGDGGGGSSYRDIPASRPYESSADRGGGGGGGGRSSGEISDDWRAGYDRSPTPPPVEARRVIGGRGVGDRSESINFDAGREEYSGRLSRYQEQEKREASQASRPRRSSRDSADGGAPASQPRTGKSASSSWSSSSSRKRSDGSSRRPSEDGNMKAPAGGPDLLSGDDPFPMTAPSRPENDFSSFATPQMYQGGAPVGPSGGWVSGPQVQQQQQQPQQQWGAAAPLSQAGQIVPYGQGAPGPQGYPGQQPQQQPWQQTQPQQQAQDGMMPPLQAQGGWGGPQTQQGQPLQQQGMQQQSGMYGQAQGAQYAGQQGQYGYPQQQQPQMQLQMQMQPQQQQMYQQQQQQQPFQQQQQQPQQSFQQQAPYQQQQPTQQQQQQQPLQLMPPQQPQYQQPQPPPQQQQQQQQQQPVAQARQPQPPPPQGQQPRAAAQQPQTAPAQHHQQPQQQQHQPQQQQTPGQESAQPQPSSSTASTSKDDWVPTEVVRAGIGGIDLAAAVGGLRQTGFKPSDVGGKSVFSGQGQRGSDGRHVGAPPPNQQHRTEHLAPPRPTVEYVEEGQEQGEEVVVRASTREFLGARSGLNKTGLSGRLQETAPSQPQHQHQQPSQQQQAPAAATAPAPSPGVTGAGQWQELPQQAGGGASGAQGPSWQTRQGGLRSTGLMGSGGGGGGGGAGQGQGEGAPASAPWQQGAAGLRRTGL